VAPGTPITVTQPGQFNVATNQFSGVAGPVALNEVEGMLANLQSSIEEALPIISELANVPLTSAAATRPANTLAPAVGNAQQVRVSSFGRVGTNVFGMDVNTRQLLVALQTELARTLPALRQLNGVTGQEVSGVNPAVPGSFAGRFVFVTNANQRILMPTGR
jgi:hypothetical protein